MNRRRFLAGAAAGTLLRPPCASPETPEAPGHPKPAYLALRRFIEPGQDAFAAETVAMDLRAALHRAVRARELPGTAAVAGSSPYPSSYRSTAADLKEAEYQLTEEVRVGWSRWVASLGQVRRIEFYPLPENLVRFEVASEINGQLSYRVGHWTIEYSNGQIQSFRPRDECLASAPHSWFRDVTAHALQSSLGAHQQLTHGVPYWRSHLDPACGIDIYGSNGIAAGDIDGDGVDEIYVCQPGGLPNRLLKFNLDGTLRDLTEAWNLGLLDDTSSALFLDLRNTGRQDLVVLRSGGPVLFVHQGSSYSLRTDAFHFQRQPLGGFTGMAAADFDRDGRLDLYLCCYVYFQSEAQFTYPAPYHDAQNGPPNFLFRNRLNADGTGVFEDCTEETGIDRNNNRFSFAPAWCDFNDDGWPDLYVANDFGRKNLYLNQHGSFRDIAREAGVEDVGPGMSASWFDYDGDGHADLYVANMWSDAGQRTIDDPHFSPARLNSARDAYTRHTRGNSLYRNRGDGTFEDVTLRQQAQFGRWAWSSCGVDFDNDGQPEILGTCGMLTGSSSVDLMGFFWRQVVAPSPPTAVASIAYQEGWNAINQFIREDYSWNGHEPNVFHVRRGDRYFDFSGISGLDFADDSRAFAITDFDGDGRPDVLLKSRLGPQLRVLQNQCAAANHSLAIQLEGTQSNRDAIGAKVRVDGQTKWLEAGSGFLSQHSKRMIFGLGSKTLAERIEITWPAGGTQTFSNLSVGRTYFIKEASSDIRAEPFRARTNFPAATVAGINTVALEDTWLLEPLPLPHRVTGSQLLLLADKPLTQSASTLSIDLSEGKEQQREQYEIFRRYLFDYRAGLDLPMSLLLNENGDAVKVYRRAPDEALLRQDLARLRQNASRALPFSGQYAVQPHRDFSKFGIAFLMSGYPDQALPYLERVLRRSPDNARVLALVARVHLDARRYTDAEGAYRRAIAAASSPEALYGLALALARQARFDDARQYFEQAIEARPGYADAINDLGVLYVQQGKLNDAVAAFRYGIRTAPDEDILYLNLGRTYARLGQIDQARQVMQELLDHKPESQTARHALQELNNRN